MSKPWKVVIVGGDVGALSAAQRRSAFLKTGPFSATAAHVYGISTQDRIMRHLHGAVTSSYPRQSYFGMDFRSYLVRSSLGLGRASVRGAESTRMTNFPQEAGHRRNPI
jgi:hypothetical protein